MKAKGFKITAPGDPYVGWFPQTFSLESDNEFEFESHNQYNEFLQTIKEAFEILTGENVLIETIEEETVINKDNNMKENKYDSDGHLMNVEVGDWIVDKNGRVRYVWHDDMPDLHYSEIVRYATPEEIKKDNQQKSNTFGHTVANAVEEFAKAVQSIRRPK